MLLRSCPSQLALGPPICTFLRISSQCVRRASYSIDPSEGRTGVWRDFEPDPSVRKVAVLGGGIAGTVAALWLKEYLKERAEVTVFESSNRTGGWLQSTRHTLGGETVVFEQGPRSLRPALNLGGASTDYLIRQCGLGDQILPTSRQSAAALNRYIYYPDRLARAPNMQHGFRAFWEDSRSLPFRGVLKAVLTEYFEPQRSSNIEDESVGSFFRRRLTAEFVDNILSAVLHGIYAGDIDRLSIRSLLPTLWQYEKAHGSITRAIIANSFQGVHVPELDLRYLLYFTQLYGSGTASQEKWGAQMSALRKSASLYTFQGGIEQLAKVVTDRAESLGVKFRYRANITELTGNNRARDKVRVSWSSASETSKSENKISSDTFTHVVSALPSKALLSAISKQSSGDPVISARQAEGFLVPASTVMVVNLYYTKAGLIKSPGFGYLIPRSLGFDQDPEFALGVVFDSYATPDLDNSSGTKLTVMLGGHWWDGWSSFPSEAEGIRMARSLLQRHLGIVDEPALAVATLQRECIPQYHVGHIDRAQELAKELDNYFGNRIELAGASWHGVSVNDCIKSGFLAAYRMASGHRREEFVNSMDPGRFAAKRMSPTELTELFVRNMPKRERSEGDDRKSG